MQNRSIINFTIIVILSFEFLLFSIGANAQQPYLPFKQLSSFDGLSHNQVLSILQDRQGFMWFGILEGLNRYDGYEFTVYHHNSKDSTSLPHDFASSIIEDHGGNSPLQRSLRERGMSEAGTPRTMKLKRE